MQTPRHLLSFLIALLSLCAPHAGAQIGLGNPLKNISRSPQLSRADIDSINRVVGFTDQQRETVLDIYEAHVNQFSSELSDLVVKLEDARDEALATNNPRPINQASELVKNWNERSAELDQQLLADLRLLLTADQEALWPRVERELRRIRLGANGVFAGESVDLVRLLDTIHTDWIENPQLKATVDAYINAMDGALTQRKRIRDDARDAMTWGGDAEKREDTRQTYEKVRRARIRVRTVNEEHLRRLLTLLPENDAGLFEISFYEKAIGEQRATTPLERRIRAVLDLPDLTNAQRTAAAHAVEMLDTARLGHLKGHYNALADAQNTGFPPSVRRYFQGEEMFTSSDDFVHFEEENLVGEVKRERFEFERSIYAELRPLLSAEQRALLPEPDDETIWFMWPVPNFL